MRRGRYAAVLLSAAVLMLAIWVTSTDPIHLLPSGSSPRPTEPTSTSTATGHHHGVKLPSYQPKPIPPDNPSILDPLIYVVLGVTAATLLAFLASAVVRRKRRLERRRHAVLEESGDAVDAFGVPPLLREAAERQLLEIRTGSPRNAIVACWMELERICGDSGLPRGRAETSTEFTARVLTRYSVDPRPVSALAALYREARFSEHHLTEADREQAVLALEEIAASLSKPKAPDPTAVAHA